MLPDKAWRPELVLRLFAGIFACVALGMMLVQGLRGIMPTGPGHYPELFLAFVGTLGFHGVSLVLINVFLRQHGLSWSEGFGFKHGPIGRVILLATMVGFAVLPMAWSLSFLSSKLMEWSRMEVVQQNAVQLVQQAGGWDQRLLTALGAIIMAPIVEELIFRGILYPVLKQTGYRKLAMWGTALFFALVHSNMVTFIPLTFFALILTLLYESTGNLLAPIIAHAVFNATNYLWLVSQLPSTQ